MSDMDYQAGLGGKALQQRFPDAAQAAKAPAPRPASFVGDLDATLGRLISIRNGAQDRYARLFGPAPAYPQSIAMGTDGPPTAQSTLERIIEIVSEIEHHCDALDARL